MIPLGPREAELMAIHLITHQDEIAHRLKAKEWPALYALAAYLAHDVPRSMAFTDPALYRTLRQGITDLHCKGWGNLNLGVLTTLIE